MKTETEIEVTELIQLQANESQGLPAASRSWKRDTGQILPQSLQRKPTLPTP